MPLQLNHRHHWLCSRNIKFLMLFQLLQRTFHFSAKTATAFPVSHSLLRINSVMKRGYTQRKDINKHHPRISSTNDRSSHNMVKDKKKIFCFGDSLTAGTAPPSFQEYPYARHLESKLNELVQLEHKQTEDDAIPSPNQSFMVRHYGLPGWTATQLSSPEGNLTPILERIKIQSKSAENTDSTSNEDTNSSTGYPSLVIILAGTNDLAYCTNETQCQSIFQSIQSIHQLCHDKNINTIALSIPSSAWQCQDNSSGSNAAMYAKLINDKLESWAMMEQNEQTVVHYIPFPIETYNPSSGYWSPDGLHFSPEGYAFIGESLAPTVKNILEIE